MNTKTLFYLAIFFLFSLSACEEESEDCFTLDIGTYVSVSNSKGLDLLDPSQEYSYKAKDIKIYHFKEPMLAVDTFAIKEVDDTYYLYLFPSVDTEGRKYSTTTIMWNDTDSNVLECAFDFESTDCGLICNEVVLDGISTWKSGDTTTPHRAIGIIRINEKI